MAFLGEYIPRRLAARVSRPLLLTTQKKNMEKEAWYLRYVS